MVKTETSDNHCTPLVSFIIAAYNEEKYIKECVDSCLHQTYPNVEVCITDDGSVDDTWDVLRSNYSDIPQVKLRRFSRNVGKVSANNTAFSMARGRYIVTLSGDDVALPNRVQMSLNFLKTEGVDLIFGKRMFCNEGLEPMPFCHRKVHPRQLAVESILFNNVCYGPTLFFTRTIAEKAFPIPQDLLFEDWWIGFIAALHGKIAYLDRYVTKYRQHENNDISNTNERKKIASIKKDFCRHQGYYYYFLKEICDVKKLKHKKRLKKIIMLNKCYRDLFLEDRLKKRLFLFPEVLRNAIPTPVLFYSLAILFGGNRLYLLKRISLYKRFALERKTPVPAM